MLFVSLIVASDAVAIDSAEGLPHSPQDFEIWSDPLSGIEFLWLPGNCFQLGNPDKSSTGFLHEKPVHEVCLNGFWVGRCEVTNSQYRQYKADHNSRNMEEYSLDGDNQPVVFVSWNEAGKFADWLAERHKGVYEFRLPTEAEWEYSCRAGSETTRYWGEDSNEACKHANVADTFFKAKIMNFHNCSDKSVVSAPVGGYVPNAVGLYDMLGNVWEWCEDNYGKDAYKKHKKDNPVYRQFESGSNYRVIRGGSWLSGPDSVRCTKRSPAPPDGRFDVLGFRLVVFRTGE